MADLFFSLRAFSQGATELNPVMAFLFEKSLPLASLFKLGGVTLAALLLWRWRNLKLAQKGLNLLAPLYGGLFLYHLFFFS